MQMSELELKKMLEQGCLQLGINLALDAAEMFLKYLEELKLWNQKINLTAITSDREIVLRHFLDSLCLYKSIKRLETDNLTLLDIGAGAGFPGLPLKIIDPGLDITLMDSIEKKVFFMRHVIRRLGLGKGVKAVCGNAGSREILSAYGPAFDVITSRAVASLKDLLPISLPLCKINGHIIAIKGPAYADELKELEIKGVSTPAIKEIQAPFEERINYIVVFQKVPADGNSRQL